MVTTLILDFADYLILSTFKSYLAPIKLIEMRGDKRKLNKGILI